MIRPPAPPAFAAAIFDVDGVLVDSPHARAWRTALCELMDGPWRVIRDRTAWTPEAFTPEVYSRLVSGRPRTSGARATLEHFGVPATEENVAAYAARKQALVTELIEAGDFAAYPDALRFALKLKASGMLLATASSSANAPRLLARVDLNAFVQEQRLSYEFVGPGSTVSSIMDADVSGRRFGRGKPDPGIFLAAAAALGVPPPRCIVVEDAVAGILAAVAGGMVGLAVARADDAPALAGAGAGLVVTSLDDVDVALLARGRFRAQPA